MPVCQENLTLPASPAERGSDRSVVDEAVNRVSENLHFAEPFLLLALAAQLGLLS